MATLLIINPGSTSTKIALYEDIAQAKKETFRHDASSLDSFRGVWDQFEFRMEAIRPWVNANVRTISAVAALGGLLRPVPGGTYRVNARMLEDARANRGGEHPSNLGCAMAAEIAREYGCEAYIVDPVSVDEFGPLARYSGHPLIVRNALSHALNLHATARRAAEALGKPADRCSFVIVHMGGGISVAPLRGGRIIDVNDASSDGPFSPERTGGLPLQQFITLCYSGSYSERAMRTLVRGRGGLTAYLGTNSAFDVEARIAGGDAKAREIYEAMAYQISKEIGAMATVLAGRLDAVVLTGGLASSSTLVSWIEERVKFLAPLMVFPGEDEMAALAGGVLQVLRGEEQALDY